MAIPTMPGDVLVLETTVGLRIHAVGAVTTKGQQDFHRAQPSPLYIANHDEALAVAQTLAARRGRIFLVKIDSNTWSELAS